MTAPHKQAYYQYFIIVFGHILIFLTSGLVALRKRRG